MEIEKKQQTQRHQIRSRSYPTSILAYSQTLVALEGVSRVEYPETKRTYDLRGEERWISQYPGMREADFPCVEMVCGLVQHKKGKGPGQIISKFEGIHEFHENPLYPKFPSLLTPRADMHMQQGWGAFVQSNWHGM